MSGNDDLLSPEVSPGSVRRVNNRPLLVVGLVALMFVGAIAMVMVTRANNQREAGDQRQNAPKKRNSSAFAQEIVSGVGSGIVEPAAAPAGPALVRPVAETPQPAPEVPVPVLRPSNADAPPLPAGGRRPDRDRDQNGDRFEQARIQSFERAVTAKTRTDAGSIPSGRNGPTQGGSSDTAQSINAVQQERARLEAMRSTDPSAAFKARLDELRTAANATVASSAGADVSGTDPDMLARATRNAASRNDLGQFSGTADRYRLASQLEAPRSKFQVTAGASVIPAVLISGINSDLPGKIRAQISQNIYDTATGRYLLIPQGTQLSGEYSTQVLYGQQGVFVAWQRLIFPDGRTLDIGSMPGADSSGYSGFRDQVDNHYVRIYASAILMSGIVAGVALSQDSSNNTSTGTGQQTTASSAMSEALGQQLGQVTGQQISKNLNIAPTLQIRPGYRFNVIVTKDLAFTQPYQAFAN